MTTKTTNSNVPANKFLAIFAKESERIENEMAQAFESSQNEAKQLTEAACDAIGVQLSEQASSIYSCMLSATAGDDIAASTGKKLAESIQTLIEAYYAGNKESMQPVIDACNVWIKVKHEGKTNTSNIPNNMRLLVSRRSQAWAQPEDGQTMHDYKLVLTVDKKSKAVTVKETKLVSSNGKTKAQKVFDAMTKLDVMDKDELIRLVATDAALLAQFASLGTLQAVKSEAVTKDTISQLEARRNAAVNTEDDLQDKLDAASEAKLALCDKIADIEDEITDIEASLTAKSADIKKLEASVKRCKKPETKAAKTEELEIARAALSTMLEKCEDKENEKETLAAQLNKAVKALDDADAAYNNQAYLVASIGKEIENARAVMAN